LQYTIQKHKRNTGDSELVVKDTFTYTAQDRLIQHTHQINGGAEQLLAENTYDELGKLTSKKVGNTSTTPLQKVDYSYNIRGWMTAINSIANLNVGIDPADLFSFKLNYNNVDGSTSAANKLYNGNIAETFWSTASLFLKIKTAQNGGNEKISLILSLIVITFTNFVNYFFLCLLSITTLNVNINFITQMGIENKMLKITITTLIFLVPNYFILIFNKKHKRLLFKYKDETNKNSGFFYFIISCILVIFFLFLMVLFPTYFGLKSVQ
jgi:hypothetical protein